MFPTAHGVVSQGGEGGAPEPIGCDQSGLATFTASNGVSAFQNGYRFRANRAITVCALKVMPRTTSQHTLRLWRVSDQELLATATHTPSGTGTWIDVPITPVTLTPGEFYAVTARTPGELNYLQSEFGASQHPAIAYDRAVYNTGDAYPTGVDSSLRAVDILFTDPGGALAIPAITSWSSPSLFAANTNARQGWQFTLKGNPITVTKLTHYGRGSAAAVWRVILHRNSDGAALAQADITKIQDAWAEESITPVALAANTTYTISGRRISGSNESHRNPTDPVLDPEFRNVVGRFGEVNDNRPTTNVGLDYLPAASFIYER